MCEYIRGNFLRLFAFARKDEAKALAYGLMHHEHKIFLHLRLNEMWCVSEYKCV